MGLSPHANSAANTHRVVRVEAVRGRRVVDDDHLVEVAADDVQVLHVVAVVVDARLAEQPPGEDARLVQEVGDRVGVLPE